MSRELKLRIISALLLAGVVLEVTWLGGWSFAVLWAIAAFLILHEFTRICSPSLPKYFRYAALTIMLIVALVWMFYDENIAFVAFSIGLLGLFAWEALRQQSFWSAIGLAYAGLPFFAMVGLRGTPQDSLLAVFVLFACVWGADIFAYIAGRSIGGPKLAPSISPNKTWSGFIGSLVGALFLSWVVVLIAGYQPTQIFLVIVLALAIISQIGDLVESSFKRRFNVKDSGAIIPGHGGVLDRIDGLIFAAVTFWVFLFLTKTLLTLEAPMPAIFIEHFLSK